MLTVPIKQAIIIHGYLGNSGKHWFPSLTAHLVSLGIDARALDLPNPNQPELGRWAECLSEGVGEPSEDLLVVTHSLGGLAVASYLGALDSGYTLGGLLAVAPFYDPLPRLPELDQFVSTVDGAEEQLAAIGRSTVRRTVIRSDNDPYVPSKHSERFAKQLGAEVVVDPSAEHFFDRHYSSIVLAANDFTKDGQRARGLL